MPNPEDFKNKDDFMDACMKETKEEGLELKQRLGKCLGMWRHAEGKEE